MRKKITNGTGALLLSLLTMGCSTIVSDSDDAKSGQEGTQNFIYTSVLGESSYLGTFSSLSKENSKITLADAYEHTKAAFPYVYEDIVLVCEGAVGNVIHKYSRSSNGDLTPAGKMDLPQHSMANEILFESSTKAYIALTGLGKVWIINPEDMKKTGEIDLTPYAEGESDNNPEPGAMLLRDDKLFVALSQTKTISPPTCYPGSWLAIIDTATNVIQKVITDSRVSNLGVAGHTTPFIDELGDMYFYGLASFGYQPGVQEGFIRIKAGETEFDQSYLFSVNSIGVPDHPAGGVQHAMKTAYAGNGMLYAMPCVPALFSNPIDFMNDKTYQPCRFDLRNQKITKLGIPPTAAWAAMGITTASENIAFGMSTDNGVGIYAHNHQSGVSNPNPVVKTEGVPMFLDYVSGQ